MDPIPAVIGTLIPIAGIALVAIIVWITEQRKGKEAYLRNELLRKIAESQEDSAQKVFEMIRQEEQDARIRRREGVKLAGLILVAIGIGLAVMLALLERSEPAWIIGSIPFLIGVALLVYVFFLGPKPDKGDSA
jgi:Flp pilus assembly protein TadB